MEAPLTDSPPHEPSAPRSIGIAALVWIAVLGGLGSFVVFMALIEPLTGDGWYNATDVMDGLTVQLLVERLTYLHHHGNPRIGQGFTLLTYGSETFHRIATPLVTLALFLLVVMHALGRAVSFKSARDALLVLFAAAGCFLAVPQPGHAFFYRPITTNYLYTLVLSLTFFLPQRLGLRLQSTAAGVIASVLAFGLGLFVGKTNEHTGPTMIIVAGAFALHALRQRSWLDVAWRSAAALGVLIGYLFLFFAPGQTERYGALGRQSVLVTILERGALGTAELLGEYAGYVGPLLVVLCLVGMLVATLRPSALSVAQLERAKPVVLAYTALSFLLLATTMAAPKNHYRLFIAPAVLLVIAAIALLDSLHGKVAMIALASASVIVCVGTAMIFVPMYTAVHEDELARNMIIQSGDRSQPIAVPRTRFSKRTPYYYGDSIVADPRHRDRMATLFKVRAIKLLPRPEKEKKPKVKAPASASPPEHDEDSL